MTFFLFFLYLGSYIIVAHANFSVCDIVHVTSCWSSNLTRFSWFYLSCLEHFYPFFFFYKCFTGSGFYSPIILSFFFLCFDDFFFKWIVFISCLNCFGESFYDLWFLQAFKDSASSYYYCHDYFWTHRAIFVGSLITSLQFSRELEPGKLKQNILQMGEWLWLLRESVWVFFFNILLSVPFPSAADPLSLHQVWTLSETCCVTQQYREPTDVQCCLYYVPSGAGNGRHNGCRSLAWWQERVAGYQY